MVRVNGRIDEKKDQIDEDKTASPVVTATRARTAASSCSFWIGTRRRRTVSTRFARRAERPGRHRVGPGARGACAHR